MFSLPISSEGRVPSDPRHRAPAPLFPESSCDPRDRQPDGRSEARNPSTGFLLPYLRARLRNSCPVITVACKRKEWNVNGRKSEGLPGLLKWFGTLCTVSILKSVFQKGKKKVYKTEKSGWLQKKWPKSPRILLLPFHLLRTSLIGALVNDFSGWLLLPAISFSRTRSLTDYAHPPGFSEKSHQAQRRAHRSPRDLRKHE